MHQSAGVTIELASVDTAGAISPSKDSKSLKWSFALKSCPRSGDSGPLRKNDQHWCSRRFRRPSNPQFATSAACKTGNQTQHIPSSTFIPNHKAYNVSVFLELDVSPPQRGFLPSRIHKYYTVYKSVNKTRLYTIYYIQLKYIQ